MTVQNLLLAIVPVPNAQVFGLVQVQGLMSSIIALNMASPVAQVALAQQDQVGGGRDLHSLVVQLADASYWIAEIEFLSGNLADPVINSESSSGTFHKNQWATFQQIRDQILDAHNALSGPSLLRVRFTQVQDQVDLTLSTTTGTAGVGTFTCTYAAPMSGHLDFLGLYHVSDAAGATPVQTQVIADFSTSGTKTFNMPGSTGAYEVRYMVGNSFAGVAHSKTLTVS